MVKAFGYAVKLASAFAFIVLALASALQLDNSLFAVIPNDWDDEFLRGQLMLSEDVQIIIGALAIAWVIYFAMRLGQMNSPGHDDEKEGPEEAP